MAIGIGLAVVAGAVCVEVAHILMGVLEPSAGVIFAAGLTTVVPLCGVIVHRATKHVGGSVVAAIVMAGVVLALSVGMGGKLEL